MSRLAHTWFSMAVLFGAATAFAEEAPTLLGCWRSQQTQITRADGSSYASNGDCVLVYSKTQATSRCRGDSGSIDNVSRIDSLDGSTLQLTSVDPGTGQAKGAPYEVRYQVDGDWLLIERRFAGASDKQPASIRSVSIRETGTAVGAQECQLRGRSPLRIGRTSVSSLRFQEPKGWRAWLVDPSTQPKIAAAVGPTLLIGAFVPAGSAPVTQNPSGFVLVLDDTRSGPRPVTPEHFLEVKQALITDLTSANIRCNEPDRICVVTELPGQGRVYMELLNLKGRIAMVMATSTVDPLSALQAHAQPFVAQLRLDNS